MNQKHQSIDDPMLTAFALGELNAADRAKLEHRIATDPDARREVEETAAFVGRLKAELQEEEVPELRPEQLRAIRVVSQKSRRIIAFPAWLMRTVVPVAIAAGLAVATWVNMPTSPTRPSPSKAIAQATQQPEDKSVFGRPGEIRESTRGAEGAQPAPTKLAEIQVPTTAGATVAMLQDQKPALGQEVAPAAPLVAQTMDSRMEERVADAARGEPSAGPLPIPARSKTMKLGVKTFQHGWAKPSADRLLKERDSYADETRKKLAYGGGQILGKPEAPMQRIYVAPHPEPHGPLPALTAGRPFNTETYDRIVDNPFLDVTQNPLSTFSIDVDTGSYANIRRFIRMDQLPPAGAVRTEEMLNYFDYDYPPAPEGKPFSVTVDIVEAPWNAKHRLARVALRGTEIDPAKRPPCNLVFLLDVSGSMNQPNKLPLVKQAMHILLEQLNEKDRVAIVTYAGTSGLALPSTTADKKRAIREAIDALRPGGSTNGEAGIQLAYDIAKANAISGGANRVILATDGDFNVGTTSRDELIRIIEEKAKSGVFLTVLGFGMGNLKDAMMEQLADKGNGTYGYIDSEHEAKRLFARHATGSLVTIAKDVKIQVEFNPAKVGAYRLIGYENRALRAEDFNDDKKDAGEIGSGHTVTALYELVPPGEATGLSPVDDLKYQPKKRNGAAATSADMMTVKLRYKKPDGDTSDKIELAVTDAGANIASASADMKFAASIAEVAMLLRDSPHKGSADWKSALELATAGKGADVHGDRAEFIELVRSAEKLADPR